MTTDQRLARLERQCRLFKAGFALTAITLVTVLLVGAGQDQEKPKVLDEVRTKSLLICSEDGERRAFFSATDDGAALGICDHEQKTRIQLETSFIGSTISIVEKNGRWRAALGCGFTRDKSKSGFSSESSLRLYDWNGKVTFKAPK